MATPNEDLKAIARKLSELRGRPCLLFVDRNICLHTVPALRLVLDACKAQALDVVVHSPGGQLNEAYIAVRQLRRRFGPNLTAFVPLEAKSAATLLCLAAEELVLGELGELGPLDTQLEEKQRGDFPQVRSCLERFKGLEQLQRHSIETFEVAIQSILQGSGMKPVDACTIAADLTGKVCGSMYTQIDPGSLGQNARYLEVSSEYAKRVLRRYRPDLFATRGSDIINTFVWSYPSHDFIIDLEELSDIGVPARQFIEEEAEIFKSFDSVIANLEGSEEDKIIEILDARTGEEEGAEAVVAQPGPEPQGPSAAIRKVK